MMLFVFSMPSGLARHGQTPVAGRTTPSSRSSVQGSHPQRRHFVRSRRVACMNTTSLGLLDRLKNAKPDVAEWHRLQDIYLPLIRFWLGRVPGLHDEADDLAQEVLVVLFRELPSFER